MSEMEHVSEPEQGESLWAGPLLRVRSAVKDYDGQRALDHMDFELRVGEVHALLGENGAGKSTLIKSIAGAISMTSGTIEVAGQIVDMRNPQAARAVGVSVVHQYGNLVLDLSVTENVLLAERLGSRVGGIFVDWPGARRRVRKLLDRVGLTELDPNVEVSKLSAHQVAMVAVAKALASSARVIILDEPTTALLPDEVRTLFNQMRKLIKEGISFVFVTHRLREVFEVCDRITVMRDGRLVGTWATTDLDYDSLVDRLVGTERAAIAALESAELAVGEIVLDVRELRNSVLQGVCFVARAGEVVGLASLPGEGAEEVIGSLYGLRRSAGEIRVNGQRRKLNSPQDAIAAGFALVPRDRLGQGLVSELSVRENASLASTSSFRSDPILRWMKRGKERNAVKLVMERLSLKSHGLEVPVRTLSGGNQQKVVIGRWLLHHASVYLLDSPTAAVDVHTKTEIYRLARELAQNGAAVIFTSTELEEFVRVCDRVLVLHAGEIAGELAGKDNNVTAIMRLSFGRKDA